MQEHSADCLWARRNVRGPRRSPSLGVLGQKGGRPPAPTHVAREQMFLWPQKGRRTVAKALPWLNISVTWEGR